jgi:hydrogenase maturation factor
MNENICNRDAEGHCITCSDEAMPARILHIDETTGLALVTLDVENTASPPASTEQQATEEVDITLLESAVVGDEVLIHGGVAIAHATSFDK